MPPDAYLGVMRRTAVAAVQGAWFAATGVWALVDIRSFQAVTGPKTDLWLVKTVGVLVTSIGATLLLAGSRRRIAPETAVLGATSAAALAGIEAWYVARKRIAKVYLGDAAVELGLAGAWLAAR
jgi:hypothetical protein